MICCKIISDFSNTNASFQKLFDSLAQIGEFLWENNSLFFADTVGNVTEKKLTSIVKKAGYTKVYIDEYTKENQPQESDYINGWLMDKIMKILYKRCEDTCQKQFRDVSAALDIIDVEIDQLYKQKEKEDLNKAKED